MIHNRYAACYTCTATPKYHDRVSRNAPRIAMINIRGISCAPTPMMIIRCSCACQFAPDFERIALMPVRGICCAPMTFILIMGAFCAQVVLQALNHHSQDSCPSTLPSKKPSPLPHAPLGAPPRNGGGGGADRDRKRGMGRGQGEGED